jgi:hypothetical protein
MRNQRQSKIMGCKVCLKNRNRPNTIDRFTDEYNNTNNYCDHYRTEVEEAGEFFCDYFDQVYRIREVTPMEPCKVCGYYGNGHSEDGTTLCYDCLIKLYR